MLNNLKIIYDKDMFSVRVVTNYVSKSVEGVRGLGGGGVGRVV